MRPYELLSIDAWSDGQCHEPEFCPCQTGAENCVATGWIWNEWYRLDYVKTVPETLDEFLLLFYGEEQLTAEFRAKFELEDDQYNMVLLDAADRRPLYAVCYGDHI